MSSCWYIEAFKPVHIGLFVNSQNIETFQEIFGVHTDAAIQMNIC